MDSGFRLRRPRNDDVDNGHFWLWMRSNSMTTEREFRDSLNASAPADGLSPALTALWWQKKGDWDRAHRAAQSDDGAEAAWVHALLHREEGDLSNAAYWYGRAGRDVFDGPLEEEWDAIVKALL
jgi:hypothetical protein